MGILLFLSNLKMNSMKLLLALCFVAGAQSFILGNLYHGAIDVAEGVGHGAANLAHNVGHGAANRAHNVGDGVAHAAHHVGVGVLNTAAAVDNALDNLVTIETHHKRPDRAKENEKRGFNQIYKGSIYSQQNIEKYDQQTFNGDIKQQLNVDNSNANLRNDEIRQNQNKNAGHRHRTDADRNRTGGKHNQHLEDRHRYNDRKNGGHRQNDGKIRCRRGFKQLYNGNIYKQQNIEKYSGQTFNGDVFSQANIDNSCQFSKRSASELDINKRSYVVSGSVSERNNLIKYLD